MSRKSSNALKVKNMFVQARNEYMFWENDMQKHGWNEDSALAAAQYYGQMCALAKVNSELFENDTLSNYLDERVHAKLFKSEYESP